MSEEQVPYNNHDLKVGSKVFEFCYANDILANERSAKVTKITNKSIIIEGRVKMIFDYTEESVRREYDINTLKLIRSSNTNIFKDGFILPHSKANEKKILAEKEKFEKIEKIKEYFENETWYEKGNPFIPDSINQIYKIIFENKSI